MSKKDKNYKKPSLKGYTCKTNKQCTPEEQKARNKYQQEIYKKDKDKILARRRELYYLRHRKKKQAYYNENKDKLCYRSKEYPNLNTHKWAKENYNSNKDYLNKQKRIRSNFKYINDPTFKIREKLRARINSYLKNNGPDNACIELTGLTALGLKRWLEIKFEPGMSWDNRSEWHIDHIKPVKLFDLTDPKQVKECYHYTNLKPAWASENREKAAR